MRHVDSGKQHRDRLQFREPFSALIDYCMAPSNFISRHSPREAQEVGSVEVLQQIARLEKNREEMRSHDPQQLAERVMLATLDVREMANHSLWAALKHVTRLVVDVELAKLRAGYLRVNRKLHKALEEQREGGQDDPPVQAESRGFPDEAAANSFRDLHELLAKHGVVDSILMRTEIADFRRWIEMCYEPNSLLAAYEANAQFDRESQRAAESQS
jgi:hypothetical protein